MAGYSKSYAKTNGDLIEAPDFDNEYTALDAAFDNATGHNHDGSLNNGAYIPLLSDTSNFNEVLIDAVNDRIVISTNVGGAKTAQVAIEDGALVPDVTNDFDLGTSGKKIKDIHAAGTANLSVLGLTSGVTVSSILDQDGLASDSDTALATQQSIKAYVDNSVTTHTHDGVDSSLIESIQSADGYNVVEIDDTNDRIAFSTDAGGSKSTRALLDGVALYPTASFTFDLGKPTERFNNFYGNNLELGSGASVNRILDEDTLVSDDDAALATQQSIKAYVDNAPGIYLQVQKAQSGATQALTGSFAVYLQKSITVEDGAYVHVHAYVAAKATGTAGDIYGRLYRDTTAIGVQDVKVVEAASVPQSDVVPLIDVDGPLTAGTYTYSIQLYHSGTTGNALHATLMLLEQRG